MIYIGRLIFILILIMSQNAYTKNLQFNGVWCWDSGGKNWILNVILRKIDLRYYGSYFSAIQHGLKTDNSEHAFNFRDPESSIVHVKLVSGWTHHVGIVQLKLLSENELEWLMIKRPRGEFFAPDKTILTRC